LGKSGEKVKNKTLFLILILALFSSGCFSKMDNTKEAVTIFQGTNNNYVLIRPTAVTTDSQGNIYVLDLHATNGFLKKFDAQGNFLKQFAPLGEADNQLQTPVQITKDSKDNLYITDAGAITGVEKKRKIQRYNKEDKFEKNIIDYQESAAETEYFGPAGIVLEKENIYLTNVDKIEKLNLRGQMLKKIGFKEEGNFGYFLSNYIYGPSSVAIDNQENIYVLDTYSGLIKIFNKKGILFQQFQPRKVAISEPLKGDIQIAKGFLYFLDSGLGTVSKFTLQGKKIWQRCSKGIKPEQLLNPTDIYLDQQNNIFIADAGNRCIKKFDAQGKFQKEIGKAEKKTVFFSQPGEVAIDKDYNIYVADTANQRVVKINYQGKVKKIIHGENSSLAKLGDNTGKLFYPGGLAIDQKNNLYIVDYDYNRKQKFNSQGKLLRAFGPGGDIAIDQKDNIYLGNGSSIVKLDKDFTIIGNWNKLQQESLYNQGNLAISKKGEVFMVDRTNSAIKKFSPVGKLLLVFGKAGSGKGELLYPNGIAAGEDGNLYVADSGNHRIEVFNEKGVFIKTIGSFGAGKNNFNFPQGIAFDNKGNLYIADTNNQRIVKISKVIRSR